MPGVAKDVGSSRRQEFIHVAGSLQAAEVVRETLRQLGRHESVEGMEDSFAEGPLVDVDTGAASRVGWYNRINPELAAGELPHDDTDLWERVHAGSADVMLWHGPHPTERIFAIRACWHLRHVPERVYEVALPTTRLHWKGGRERPAFYDAVAIAGPKATVQAWDQRAKVLDVSERAKQWELLRDEPGDWIRVLEGEAIVQLPITAYDAAILDACTGRDWTPSSRVLGEIFAAHPIGSALLTWRIRELLRLGKLQGRGEENRGGLPAELRPVC